VGKKNIVQLRASWPGLVQGRQMEVDVISNTSIHTCGTIHLPLLQSGRCDIKQTGSIVKQCNTLRRDPGHLTPRSGGKRALSDFAGIGVSRQSIIRAYSKKCKIAIFRTAISSAQVSPAIGDEFLRLWLAARNTYFRDYSPWARTKLQGHANLARSKYR
jgi:hypothetical protein